MVSTLSTMDDGILTWWVDASYTVHNGMWGHTGGMRSAGTGFIYSTSNKQKLFSHSSTKAELVGVYDMMPRMVWVANFLFTQGVSLQHVVLMQDNMSSILLEKNGHDLSSKCTKHTAIWHFNIKE